MAHEVTIAILARAPVPGRAKTRLIPILGIDGAAQLQAAMIDAAIETALAAAIGPLTLWTTPDAGHPVIRRHAARPRVTIERQPDGDLGARMLTAAMQAHGPVLILGTDCPALTAGHLRHAARAFADGEDAVVIPALDGGYVLIGMRRPQPGLFSDMPWGTAHVMEESRRRLKGLALRWRELAALPDIDLPADLVHIAGDPRFGFAGGPRVAFLKREDPPGGTSGRVEREPP